MIVAMPVHAIFNAGEYKVSGTVHATAAVPSTSGMPAGKKYTEIGLGKRIHMHETVLIKRSLARCVHAMCARHDGRVGPPFGLRHRIVRRGNT